MWRNCKEILKKPIKTKEPILLKKNGEKKIYLGQYVLENFKMKLIVEHGNQWDVIQVDNFKEWKYITEAELCKI